MKYLLSLLYVIFISLITLLTPSKILANFTRYVNNPLLTTGIPGSWESSSVIGISVIWDQDLGVVWYTGFDGQHTQIGYGTISFDINNSIKIEKSGSNPIIPWNIIYNFNNYDQGVSNPAVLKQNNNYSIWLNNYIPGGAPQHAIYYMTSNDVFSWNNPHRININLPNNVRDLTAPAVYYNQLLNKYQMWFGSRFTNSINAWKISYAESFDGLNWINTVFPVLETNNNWEGDHITNPSIIVENNIYYLFYHGSMSIFYATSLDGIHWIKNEQQYALESDGTRVSDPFIVKHNNKFYLFYNGITAGVSGINVAISDTLPPSTINTPTPTPTETPTPTPTPTIDPESPIVILPGLGSTWNPLNVLSCDLSSSGTWKIAPYVHVYNRLINTLTEKAGKNPDEDFFVYGYDWRQGLDKQADNLNDYLANTVLFFNPGKKVLLFGHSLGGLVIRSFLTKFSNSHVARAITAGSPHQGTVFAYPIWENGEFWIDDLTIKGHVNRLIEYCKIKTSVANGKPQTRREVVQSVIPSFKDLLPVFDYIYNKNHIPMLLPYMEMQYQNDWLINNPAIPNLNQTDFRTITGTGFSTLNLLNVNNPNQKDLTSENWLDGKPIPNAKEYTSSGDGTILNLSSRITGVPDYTIGTDHGDLVSSTEGIAQILQLLELPQVTPAAVVPLPERTASNIMTITIDQPALLQLTDSRSNIVESSENTAILFDPEPGNYNLIITPKISSKGYLLIQKLAKNNQDSISTLVVNLVKDVPLNFSFLYTPGKDLKFIPNP